MTYEFLGSRILICHWYKCQVSGGHLSMPSSSPNQIGGGMTHVRTRSSRFPSRGSAPKSAKFPVWVFWCAGKPSKHDFRIKAQADMVSRTFFEWFPMQSWAADSTCRKTGVLRQPVPMLALPDCQKKPGFRLAHRLT